MGKLFGILALIAGVVFPMALFGWLAMRMNRKPPLPSRVTGLLLAFNGVLPVGLILVGLGQLAPQFWAQPLVRIAAYAALAAAAVIFLLLVAGRRPVAPAGGSDG